MGYAELDVAGYERIADTDTPSSRGCPKLIPFCLFSIVGLSVLIAFVTVMILFVPEPSPPVSGMITVINDYNQDVLVMWMKAGPWIKFKRWEKVKKEMGLMPEQSDGCKSGNAEGESEVVTKINTQIYVNNQWSNLLSYTLPYGVYTANYTVSQIRGPQSNSP
jgi:hypothetical protein